MTAPEFVTVEQAADYLNVPKSLVLGMVRDGRLTGYARMAEIDSKVHATDPQGRRVGADSHCSAARWSPRKCPLSSTMPTPTRSTGTPARAGGCGSRRGSSAYTYCARIKSRAGLVRIVPERR